MTPPKRPLASAPPERQDETPDTPVEPQAPPAPEPPVEPAAEPDKTEPATVKGRWIGEEACFNPQQGLIEPGDEIEVSREQLDDPNTPVIPLDQPWTRPDPQGSDS